MNASKDKGLYNSSITRVRPFFRQLFSMDSTGKKWLPKLLNQVKHNTDYFEKIDLSDVAIMPELLIQRPFSDKILGKINLEACFEFSFPPSQAFLQWLIEHPEELCWPNDGKEKYGDLTQTNRERLVGKHGTELQKQMIREALALLNESGSWKSKRKWWAFEGFTEFDCYLETETLCLAIEGKRKEQVSKAINWFPQRNQIIRNLEVLKERAGSKDYALILMSEDGIDPINDDVYTKSLPHFDSISLNEIKRHYLGCVSWERACKATGVDIKLLPDTRFS